jgi:N-acetylmuramoyl-L-alanine amidase
MPRLAPLALLVLALAPDVRAADKAEAAYREAQKAFWELKASAAKQKLRHHWRTTADRFEHVASQFPASARTPDALYTAGTLLADLHGRSQAPEDLADAVKDLLRLVERHPRHKLADDGALALAKLLAERKGEKARAAQVLSHALEAQPKGDVAPKLRALLATLEPAAARAVAAKESAAKESAALREAAERKAALEAAVREAATREAAALARADKEAAEKAALAKRLAAKEAQEAKEAKEAKEREAAARRQAELQAEKEVALLEAAAKARALREAAAREAEARAALEGAGAAEDAGAETDRPGRSSDVPRATERSRMAEAVQRQARRVVAAAPVPAAREVPPEELAQEEEAAAEAEQAALEEEIAAQVRAGVSLPRPVPPAPPAEAPARGYAGAGKSLVDAVARFAREDVPRVFEDPAQRRAREAEARRRLKAAAEASRRAELTLAEQLGLKVRRVVIDAGHGGKDTGAIGKKGTREKDVSLGIALKLGELLEEQGLEVILTRDDDRFLKLEERSRLANQAHGDLFISIHCNSALNRKARGVETYTLNISADRYSMRLAARENAASEKGVSDLQYILADLATKANTEESSRLARQVQSNLVGHLGRKYKDVRDLGHKEALFFVLLGARMPAILVETAFLSNAEEEARLASGAYQAEVARAIAHGVQDFLGNRAHVAKVP